jgi:hypothetical protein
MGRTRVSVEPIEWLLLSVVTYGLGVYGGNLFAQSTLISGGWPWSSTGGFNSANFAGLLMQTFLLPLSGVSLLIFTAQTHKHAHWSHGLKAALLFGVAAWAMVSAVISYTEYGAPILRCAIVGCVSAQNDDDGYYSYSMAPYTFITGTVNFTVCHLTVTF